MKLKRRDLPPAAISLVSMIDVLMIMLIFFMVTSTFLDLDMIPLVDGGAAQATTAPPPPDAGTALIRLGPDGLARFQGAVQDGPALGAALAARLAADPGLSVVILPSGGASTQALVTLMEQVTGAGITRLRILRLEALP